MPGTNSYPTLCLNAEKMRGDKVFEIVFLEVNLSFYFYPLLFSLKSNKRKCIFVCIFSIIFSCSLSLSLFLLQQT